MGDAPPEHRFLFLFVRQGADRAQVIDDGLDLASRDIEISRAVQHDHRLASAAVIVEHGGVREFVTAAGGLGVIGALDDKRGISLFYSL